MKYICLIFGIFLFLPSFSQSNSFFKEFQTDNSVERCLVASLRDRIYVGSTIKNEDETQEYGEILVFDFDGNVVNKREFKYGKCSGLSCIKRIDESGTLFISYYIDKMINNQTCRNIYIEQINADLSTDRIYHISTYCDTLVSIRDIELICDSKIVVLEDVKIDELEKGRATIRVIDLLSNEQLSFLSEERTVSYPFDIKVDNQNRKISLYYFGNSPDHRVSLSRILDIDYKLDSIFYFIPDQSVDLYTTTETLSDSTYILSGKAHLVSIPVYDAISVHKMTLEHDTVKGVYLYPKSPLDTILYPFLRQNVSISMNRKIAIGGIYNLDEYSGFYQDTPCWVQLSLFDENFEMITQRYFGDGVKAYYGWDITSTNDGGFVMCGQIFNTQSTANKFDLFVLKVNSEGLITGNNEIESPQMTEVIIWPNPGSDLINLKSAVQLKNAVFELYNASGNLCHTEKLSPGTTQTIHAEHLSKGIYTYRITDGNRLVKSGKWIKE